MCNQDDKKLTTSYQAWAETNKVSSIPPITTSAGIEVKPLYTTLDAVSNNNEEIGLPGEYPYTRGVYPLMHRSKVWTMRQYSGYSTAKESNERNKYFFQQGVTGLSVAFDLPTQMGYDSDHPDVEEEVGRVGVAVDTLADMEMLFDGLPLDQISTSFTINAITPIILAMYIAVGEKQGVPTEKLTGTVQNDILKEYFSRGAYIFPLRPSMKMVGDTFEFCSKKMPKYVPLSVCGYHIRETGSDAAQEIAYAFCNAIAYIENAVERGLNVDSFAPRISFNLTAHMDLFEEVAKFRAARRLWAKLLKDRLGAKDPRSWKFLYFAGTGGSTYTAQQPDNNIIRGTLETLAIVLGGCQALTVNTKDEGHAIPTAEASITALRTQQIIALESGVTNTVDPLGGSWYVESLTDAMEREIVKIIQDVDNKGGMIKCIEDGYVQRSILKNALRTQRDIESGKKSLVGVNTLTMEEAPPEKLHQYSHEHCLEQKKRLEQVKRNRDEAQVQIALADMGEAAKSGVNIMETTLAAVKAYATVGEMTTVLKGVYGTFREPLDLF